MHHILCESPFISRDFYAIRPLILWHILGTFFLIWGAGKKRAKEHQQFERSVAGLDVVECFSTSAPGPTQLGPIQKRAQVEFLQFFFPSPQCSFAVV